MKENLLRGIKKYSEKIALVLVVILALLIIIPANLTQAAGALTSAKDLMVNNRPSVSTTLSTAVTAGNTTINVASTTGILPNDVITLPQGTPETLTVATIIDATHLSTTTAAANAHTISSAVYMKQISVHTVTFTTHSVVASGSFDVIFTGATTSTGVPTTQFDFNSLAGTDVSMTCGGCTVGTKTITAASGKVNVAFSTSIAASTAISITIGSANKLLNPTKTAAAGTADIWGVVINENDATPAIVDASSIDIGTIESVSVTATVTPSLSFTINAVTSATSVAGKSTSVTSTAVTVPFGTLTAATQKYIAQFIGVGTNASAGYAVTTYEDGTLRTSAGTPISDFSTTAAEHNNTDGFGFSLANKTNSPCTSTLLFNASSRTLNASGFGSSGTPIQIMASGSATTLDECYVLYDLQVNAGQAPGSYQNLVTYIATATY